MSKRWIFQDIKDAADEVLYKGSSMAEIEKNVPAYYERLREKVDPETYVRYELWTCDIYVDIEYILYVTAAIYGDRVTRDQVSAWVLKHKEPHQVLTFDA